MIPILFEATENLFTSNGLGRLRDCIEATVTEERNGLYELNFKYPVDGANYDLIQCGRVVGVTHDDSGDIQPFDIVSCTRPIGGIVEFHCTHISYRLTGFVTGGTGVNSLADAFTVLTNDTAPAIPFTFQTDFTSTGYMSAMDGTPRSVRQMLGGIEGSVLDAYGGEYEWDRFTVKLWKQRGRQRDFTIRYGVNLLDYKDETDYQGTYTSCIPFWAGDDGAGGKVFVIGNKTNSGLPTVSGRDVCIALDLSDKFETKPTRLQVQNLAKSLMQSGQVNLPKQNISVDFVRLQDLGEYEGFENLLQCNLCDSIKVIFPQYGMEGWFKIVKTEFDVLRGKYTKLELGDLSTTLAQALGITGEKTGGGIGLISVDANNDVVIASNVKISGSVTVSNHTSEIGYMPADIDSQTASIATGSGLKDTNIGFTLDPGRWILVASVIFPANNTGYRGVAWGYDTTTIESTRERGNKLNASYTLDLQTVAIVSPSVQRTYTVRAFQTSGSALTVTVHARAIRIA